MRCLNCHYDLANLPDDRCPECGRTFDPDDVTTFTTWEPRAPVAVVANGLLFMLWVAWFAASFALIGFSVLSHMH